MDIFSLFITLIYASTQASMSDSVRRRMIKERVAWKAEEYWFMTDHSQLRAAAAELFLNLLFCEDFFNEIVRVHFLCFNDHPSYCIIKQI